MSQIPRPCCPGGHYASRFCCCQILCHWKPPCRARANRNSQPVAAGKVCWQEASRASEEATCSCPLGRQTSSFRSSFNEFWRKFRLRGKKLTMVDLHCWHGLQHHDLLPSEKQSLGRDSCFKSEILKNPTLNSKAFWRKQRQNFWKVNL